MGWKNIFIGEKMPDKDDPQYRQRYETEVQAGRKFAKTMKLDVLAAKVQLFANDHKRLFLYLVFGFIIFCLGLNIYRLVAGQTHQNYSDKNCNISNCKTLIINVLDLLILDIFRIFIV